MIHGAMSCGSIVRRALPSLSILLLSASTPSIALASPGFERGVLSAGSPAPADALARAYLAASPDRRGGVDDDAWTTRTIPRADGALVVLRPTVTPDRAVLGGQVALRIDGAGQVRWISGGAPVDVAAFSASPRVSAADARAAVAAAGRATSARLIVDARGPSARLAWEIRLPRSQARPRGEVVLVDAETGHPYARAPLTWQARDAHVYPANPIATPDLATVDLSPWLLGGAESLEGPDFTLVSCVDTGRCVEVWDGQAHACDLAPLATTSPEGDFLAFTPDDTSPNTSDDGFAEVSITYHLGRGLDMFRDLGFDALTVQPMTVIANYRDDSELACVDGSPAPGSTLAPVDNAFFAPAGGVAGVEAPVLALGQGQLDWGYDGDVVVHELTHAVMDTVCPDLRWSRNDAYGVDTTGGGIGEGTSDYFSSVLMDDADSAEYGASVYDEPYIRTLEHDKACPGGFTGEPHDDGEPWAGTLWAARQGLGAPQRPRFDQAVFTAMYAFGADDGQASAAAKILAEAELELDAQGAAWVRSVFEQRGYFDEDCAARIVDLPDSGDVVPRDALLSIPWAFAKTLPLTSQVRVEVPPGGADLTFWTDVLSLDSEDVLEVVARRDVPVGWTHREPIDEYDTADADIDATRRGAFDVPFGLSRATLALEEGTWHLQMIARSEYLAWAITTGLHVDVFPREEPVEENEDEAAGCCQGGRAPGSGTLAVLVCLGLTSRRRPGRRRCHGCS